MTSPVVWDTNTNLNLKNFWHIDGIPLNTKNSVENPFSGLKQKLFLIIFLSSKNELCVITTSATSLLLRFKAQNFHEYLRTSKLLPYSLTSMTWSISLFSIIPIGKESELKFVIVSVSPFKSLFQSIKFACCHYFQSIVVALQMFEGKLIGSEIIPYLTLVKKQAIFIS